MDNYANVFFGVSWKERKMQELERTIEELIQRRVDQTLAEIMPPSPNTTLTISDLQKADLLIKGDGYIRALYEQLYNLRAIETVVRIPRA